MPTLLKALCTLACALTLSYFLSSCSKKSVPTCPNDGVRNKNHRNFSYVIGIKKIDEKKNTCLYNTITMNEDSLITGEGSIITNCGCFLVGEEANSNCLR